MTLSFETDDILFKSIFRDPIQYQYAESFASTELKNLHNITIYTICVRHFLRLHHTTNYQGKIYARYKIEYYIQCVSVSSFNLA